MYIINKSRERLLIILLNFIAITASLIEIYKSNVEFYSENIHTKNTFIYILIIITSIVFIKNNKILLAISILFFLDMPFILKSKIQDFILFSNFSTTLFHTHLITFLILATLIFITLAIFRNNYRVLLFFLLFFYLFSLIKNLSLPFFKVKEKLKIKHQVEYISKNYYFLLFDEYPNELVITKYTSLKKKDMLSSNLKLMGFINVENIRSNYTNTQNSTTALLTGVIEKNYSINQTINSLTNNVFLNRKNYQFNSISIFDQNNRKNSLVTIQFFHSINSLLCRYIIPYVFHFFSKRGYGLFTDYEDYHKIAVRKLDSISKKNQKNITYVHFYTPHTYPLAENSNIENRLMNANKWIKKCIYIIQKNDPNSGIIIFSDHGLRSKNIPEEDWTRNILYYKNINIDTAIINNQGLSVLLNAINY